MKKATESIRIGLVRRRSVSPNPNDDQSLPNVQQETKHQSDRKQPSERRISRSAPFHPEVHNQKPISTFGTAKIVRLRGIDGKDSGNPHYPDTDSSLTAQEGRATDLNQIPTKEKWSKRKKILVGVSTTLLLAAAIVIAIVLGVLLTRPTGSTKTITTTLSPIIVSAYWSFDNTVADFYNVYNGLLINGATYSTVATNMPYVGYGRALNLLSASSQSFLVSTPFFNLSYTSFTIEAWIYPTSTTGDRGIFGQCQCSTCPNQCLYLILRGTHLYIGFTSNDLSGLTTLTAGYWYHIAFVYNYETQQQILYVNGVQDTINSNADPYKGQNGSIQIGSTQVYFTTNYFNGYIDNLIVTTQAKSAQEILSDASLFAYYSFDLPSTNVSSGPNGLNGTLVGTITDTGRVNQAVRFIGAASYFVVYGLYYVPYGVSNTRSFSISMWINPSTATSSTIVQLFATGMSSLSCVNLLGIYAPAASGGQLFALSSNSGPSLLTGPFVTQNTWTHISLTFGSTDGYTLYVNGISYGSTGATTYVTSNTFAYLYIGYYSTCTFASENIAFQGSVDEIYIHSRELTQADVTTLANP